MRRPNTLSSDIEYSCKYVKENVFQKIFFNELVAKINLFESRFKHKFKEEIGIPPNEYIVQMNPYGLSVHRGSFVSVLHLIKTT